MISVIHLRKNQELDLRWEGRRGEDQRAVSVMQRIIIRHRDRVMSRCFTSGQVRPVATGCAWLRISISPRKVSFPPGSIPESGGGRSFVVLEQKTYIKVGYCGAKGQPRPRPVLGLHRVCSHPHPRPWSEPANKQAHGRATYLATGIFRVSILKLGCFT